MRGSLIVVLMCWSIAVYGCGSRQEADPEALQGEAASLIVGSDANRYARAEALLDRALRKDAAHVPSLLMRSSLRARRHDLAGALADIDAAFVMLRWDPVLSALRCMLRERVGADAPLACYANVLDMYRNAGIDCGTDLNCVLAASMASTQDAVALRDRYLSGALSPADLAIAELVLRDFDRKSYLHSILP
jgi:uncharacterized protein HemY